MLAKCSGDWWKVGRGWAPGRHRKCAHGAAWFEGGSQGAMSVTPGGGIAQDSTPGQARRSRSVAVLSRPQVTVGSRQRSMRRLQAIFGIMPDGPGIGAPGPNPGMCMNQKIHSAVG